MINRYTREQILLNTTMLVDLANRRLLKNVLDQNKVTLGYINSNLPGDFFLKGFSAPIPIPSDRLIITLELRKRMQKLALAKGIGNQAQAYNGLPIHDHPPWWHHGGGVDRQITELDNLTHRQWMLLQLQQHPGLDRLGVQRASPNHPPTQPGPVTLAPPAQPVFRATGPTFNNPPPAPARHRHNIDPRLMGPNPGAGVLPVLPNHHANSNGGVSYYVEPQHRQGRRSLRA
jgi:hypothetical protein